MNNLAKSVKRKLNRQSSRRGDDLAVGGENLTPANAADIAIETPEEFDILLGRGRTSWGHVGNKRFRAFVGLHLKQYMETSSRTEKSKIVHTIYDDIMKAGGRFLKNDPNTGLWHPVERKMAREKIAHALRDAVGMRIKLTDTSASSLLVPQPSKDKDKDAGKDNNASTSTIPAANLSKDSTLSTSKSTGSLQSTSTNKDSSTSSGSKERGRSALAKNLVRLDSRLRLAMNGVRGRNDDIMMEPIGGNGSAAGSDSTVSTKSETAGGNSDDMPPPAPAQSPFLGDATPKIANFSKRLLPGGARVLRKARSVRSISAPVAKGPPTNVMVPPAQRGARAVSHGPQGEKEGGDTEALAGMVSRVLNEMESSGDLHKKNATRSSKKKAVNAWSEEDLSGGFSVMSLDTKGNNSLAFHDDTEVSADFSLRSSMCRSRMSLDDIDISGEFGFDNMSMVGRGRSAEFRKSHGTRRSDGVALSEVEISEDFGLHPDQFARMQDDSGLFLRSSTLTNASSAARNKAKLTDKDNEKSSEFLSLEDMSLPSLPTTSNAGGGKSAFPQEASEELSVRTTDTEREWRKTVKALAAA